MNIYTFTEGITGKVPVHILAQNCEQADKEAYGKHNLNPRVWVMKCVTKEYRGFTLEKETEPWAIKFGGYVRFYPSDGIDCDWTGDGWRSNVDNARTVKEAMDEIDERIN